MHHVFENSNRIGFTCATDVSALCPLLVPLSPWPYANLEKGYDLVTGEQAPERIFR